MSTGDETPTEVVPPSVEGSDGFNFDLGGELPPPPPRRRRLPLLTAGLALCAAVGAGVVFGILIQKHWGGSGGGGSRAATLAPSAASRTGQSGGSNGRGTGTEGFTRAGTIGQVKAIEGTSLYITDLQGNTIKVTTTPGVRVRVTSKGTLKNVHPGDYVTVQGTQTASGYQATSITDSGTESPFGGFGGGGVFGRDSSGGQQSGGNGGAVEVPKSSGPALPGLP
jgi:hypothetical protein